MALTPLQGNSETFSYFIITINNNTCVLWELLRGHFRVFVPKQVVMHKYKCTWRTVHCMLEKLAGGEAVLLCSWCQANMNSPWLSVWNNSEGWHSVISPPGHKICGNGWLVCAICTHTHLHVSFDVVLRYWYVHTVINIKSHMPTFCTHQILQSQSWVNT